METFKCSYKIEADRANNRLFLIMRGMMVDEYVSRAVNKIRCEVHKLENGFDLIDDLSSLEPGTPEDKRRILKAYAFAMQRSSGNRRKI